VPRVLLVNARFDIRPAAALWRAVRDWRPDVIHSWHWMSAAAAVPACLSFRVPLVDGSIRRGDLPKEPLRPHRLLMHAAQAVVANSRAGLRAYGIAEGKGRVVYNAFDPARLGARLPRGEDGRLTVAMCARMDRNKDFDTVIAAARRLVSASPGGGAPGWRFLLIGDGSDRERLARSAADLIGAGHLEIVSPGLEVIGTLSQADIAVLMTNPEALAEGCSNALLEYMACGLPVVCSESGGNREVVLDGQTGYVVRPRDADALAQRLLALRDDPRIRARMGEAGRRRLELEFSLQRMVDGYREIYEGVLRRHR
jgi:glycosyltransferase involved in cell wall biosynthesis